MTMYINPTDTHTHTTASAHHTQSLRLSCLGKEVSLKRRSERLNVICHHSVSHHMFAGDTELYKSDSPSEAFTLARTIESCIRPHHFFTISTGYQSAAGFNTK